MPIQFYLGFLLVFSFGVVLYLNISDKKKRDKVRISRIINEIYDFIPHGSQAESYLLQSPRERKDIAGSLWKVLGYSSRNLAFADQKPKIISAVWGLVSAALSLEMAFRFGFFYGILFFPLFIGGVRLYFSRVMKKYKGKLVEQLPDAVSMMARSLRVGVPLGRALMIVARESPLPTSRIFSSLAEEASIGRDLGSSLQQVSNLTNISEYKFFSIIIVLQTRTGGGLSEMLENLASTVRRRDEAKKKAIAMASEARASCYVLSFLPIVMGGMIFFVNPTYIMVLFNTHAGNRLMITACIMFVLGVASMVMIAKSVVK